MSLLAAVWLLVSLLQPPLADGLLIATCQLPAPAPPG